MPGEARSPTTAWKTAIVFWGEGTESPGWLVSCLSELAFRGVNLTRIESRPLRSGLGSYMFFVDLEGRESDAQVARGAGGLRGRVECAANAWVVPGRIDGRLGPSGIRPHGRLSARWARQYQSQPGPRRS